MPPDIHMAAVTCAQGNFIDRALKFVEKFFDQTIPGSSEEGQDAVAALGSELTAKVNEYLQKLEKMQLRAGIVLAMEVSAIGNKFIQVNGASPCTNTIFISI